MARVNGFILAEHFVFRFYFQVIYISYPSSDSFDCCNIFSFYQWFLLISRFYALYGPEFLPNIYIVAFFCFFFTRNYRSMVAVSVAVAAATTVAELIQSINLGVTRHCMVLRMYPFSCVPMRTNPFLSPSNARHLHQLNIISGSSALWRITRSMYIREIERAWERKSQRERKPNVLSKMFYVYDIQLGWQTTANWWHRLIFM